MSLLERDPETWEDGLLGEYNDGGFTVSQRQIIEKALQNNEKLRQRYEVLRDKQCARDDAFIKKLISQ